MNNVELLSNVEKIDKATSNIKKFIESLVDENSFVETDVFYSGKCFDGSVEALGEGVVTGYATKNGAPVQIVAQNADVLKGSMSKAHADKICRSLERACNSSTPVISIIDSCGARVGDGVSVLDGYAKVLRMASIVAENVPHVCVVKGVCVGMMAAYAATADFTIMSKDAVMSVNPPMYLVSDAKTFPVDYKAQLGADAYKTNSDLAQFTYKTEKDLNEKLNYLFKYCLTLQTPCESDDDPNRVNPNIEKMDAVDAVKLIFDENSTLAYSEEYAKEVGCFFATMNNIPVGVVATKGDYISINGLQKAVNFIKKVDSLGLSLVTLVDTKGVDAKLCDEQSGLALKVAELFNTIHNTSVNKIGVAFGNAIGLGYVAFLSKETGFDYVLATTKAKISPVSEEVSVAMMADQLKAQDRNDNIEKLSHEYAEMQNNPLKAAGEGAVDNVVEATNLRPYISSALMMVQGI